MSKEKNRSNKEVRKPKKAKPLAKPVAVGERVPGKVVQQPQQSEQSRQSQQSS